MIKKMAKINCSLERNGFGMDCALCNECFFETYSMCVNRNPNLTQKMHDEIYEDFEDNFSEAEADQREQDEYFSGDD